MNTLISKMIGNATPTAAVLKHLSRIHT